jgi:deoxyribodipyrimidine photo-lyase
MKIQNYGIHWFRRDLRIAGNENLRKNWKICGGRTLGLFCFDADFLKRSDFSHNRFAFFLKTLKELKSELQAQGGDLLVVNAQPDKAFTQILDYLKKHEAGLPQVVTYGSDYEPFARARDAKINTLLASYSIQVSSGRDHVLLEPHEILKDDQSFYQVYSPYARRWFDKMQSAEIQQRIKNQLNIDKYYERLKSNTLEKIFDLTWDHFKALPLQDSLLQFENENNKSVTISVPEAGFQVAYEKLQAFKENVHHYQEQRDFPAIEGTSQLSMYQKNGSLVSTQILATLGLHTQAWHKKENATQFVKEIAWREFYYSVMYHRPSCEKQSFLPQYVDLKWQNNESWFLKWCEGATGYPIVDAGMRQLNTTGWMHNRVRMIVASFLVRSVDRLALG